MTLHTIDVIDIEPVEHFSFLEISKLCALSAQDGGVDRLRGHQARLLGEPRGFLLPTNS